MLILKYLHEKRLFLKDVFPSLSGDQLIAYSPYVHDLNRRIVLQVFAQAGNEHIQAAAGKKIIIAPDMQQDRFSVHHLVFIQQE